MANVLEGIIRGRDELTGAIGSSLRSLDSIAGRVTALSTSFIALQMVGAAITRTLSGVVENLSGIYRASKELGVTTDEVQKLSFAAGQAGNSLQGFMQPIQLLQERLPQITDTLAKMGVSEQEIRDRAPTEVLITMAKAFERVESQTDKNRLAFEIWGRIGKKVLADLAEGSETLRQNFEKAPLVDEETIRRAEQFGDAIAKWKLQMEAWLVDVFAGLPRAVAAMKAAAADLMGGGGPSLADAFRFHQEGAVGSSSFAGMLPSKAEWDAYGRQMSEAMTKAADDSKAAWKEFVDWRRSQQPTLQEEMAKRDAARQREPGRVAVIQPILTMQPVIAEQVNRAADAAENAAIRMERAFEAVPTALKDAWDKTVQQLEYSFAESIVYGERWSDAMSAIIKDFKVQVLQMMIDLARQAIVTGFLKIIASLGIGAVTGGVGLTGVDSGIIPTDYGRAYRPRIPSSGLGDLAAAGMGAPVVNVYIRTGLASEVRAVAAEIISAGRTMGLV